MREHYTDFGILPLDVLRSIYPAYYWSSFHSVNGELPFQVFLFLLASVAGVALLIGWHSRLAAVISWVMLISVQHRNPLILQGGDVLIRVTLLAACFLPLDSYWAVATQKTTKNPVPLLPSLFLTVQLASMYWVTYTLKTGLEWRNSELAVYYALSLETLVNPAGVWLREHFTWLTRITAAVLDTEWYVPFLLFVPGRLAAISRITAVGIFCAMHLCFAASLQLGPFPWIAIVAWTAMLPETFWQRLGFAQTLRSSAFAPEFTHSNHFQSVTGEITGGPSSDDSLNTRPLLGWMRSYPARVTAYFDRRSSVILDILSGTALVIIVMINLHTVGVKIPAPQPMSVVYGLGLDQNWDMFSPSPPMDDAFYIAPGYLKNGKEVDVLKLLEHPVLWQYEPDPEITERRRKFFLNLRYPEYGAFLDPYALFLCRQWNEKREGENRLHKFEVYAMVTKTELPPNNKPPVKKLLWQQQCP